MGEQEQKARSKSRTNGIDEETASNTLKTAFKNHLSTVNALIEAISPNKRSSSPNTQ